MIASDKFQFTPEEVKSFNMSHIDDLTLRMSAGDAAAFWMLSEIILQKDLTELANGQVKALEIAASLGFGPALYRLHIFLNDDFPLLIFVYLSLAIFAGHAEMIEFYNALIVDLNSATGSDELQKEVERLVSLKLELIEENKVGLAKQTTVGDKIKFMHNMVSIFDGDLAANKKHIARLTKLYNK